MTVRQLENFREEQQVRKLVILAVLAIILLLALAQFGPSAIFGAGLNQMPAPFGYAAQISSEVNR